MKKILVVTTVLMLAPSTSTALRAVATEGSERRSASAKIEVIEQVLVKVNGDIITKTQLEQQQVAALRQKLNVQQLDPETLKNDAQLKKALADVTPSVLVGMVDQLLVVQHGKDLGLRLGDDQFKQVVSNIRKEQGLQDDKKFADALASEGMTMDDLRKQLEQQMLVEQVQRQEVGSKLQITEEEAHQYYERHPDEFTQQSQVTLREIMIAVPAAQGGVNVAADDAAKAKALDARARLLKGEDFAKVAAEVSDSASKANGGLIGPFPHEDMSSQLQAIVDKMKPGEITAPLRGDKGYQLFKLESVTKAALQPFDKVRDLIAERVAGVRTQTEMRKFIARLRTQAIIEWKNEELKKAYEKQIAAEPQG